MVNGAELRQARLDDLDGIMKVQIIGQSDYVGTAKDLGGDPLYGGGISTSYGIRASELSEYVTDKHPGGYYERHAQYWANVIRSAEEGGLQRAIVVARSDWVLGAIATENIVEDESCAVEITRLFAELKGKRIGSLLVAVIAEIAGDQPLYVTTSKTAPARHFYASQGFVLASTQPTTIPTLAGRYYHEQMRLVREPTPGESRQLYPTNLVSQDSIESFVRTLQPNVP